MQHLEELAEVAVPADVKGRSSVEQRQDVSLVEQKIGQRGLALALNEGDMLSKCAGFFCSRALVAATEVAALKAIDGGSSAMRTNTRLQSTLECCSVTGFGERVVFGR